MADPIYDIDTLIKGLRQQRVSIKVQLALGRAELRDEWQELENKREQLRSKAYMVAR